MGAACFGDVLCGVSCWRNALSAGNLLGVFGILGTMNDASQIIGRRVLVAGIMGSGKSTFAAGGEGAARCRLRLDIPLRFEEPFYK